MLVTSVCLAPAMLSHLAMNSGLSPSGHSRLCILKSGVRSQAFEYVVELPVVGSAVGGIVVAEAISIAPSGTVQGDGARSTAV
jgi:hypothetical protein